MEHINLSKYGIENPTEIIYNPSYDQLYKEETNPDLEGYEKGKITELGAVNVMTGIFTGRCPKDKYIVKNSASEDLWWTNDISPNDNKPLSEEAWRYLKKITAEQLSHSRLFVVDAFCGANEDSRLKVRFIVEVAWQAHFVTNMFIRPSADELKTFGDPDFVVMTASKTTNEKWNELGMNSNVYTVFNLEERMQVIGGTWYGGEMKKGMFSMMNYYLPKKGIASMHCSANKGKDGDVAVFFGLSGTGKTTLSTDQQRELIGDDEHGWDNDGIFNFEGGCYAKTMHLDKDAEPDIYNAIRKDALLENVTVDENGKIDFDSGPANTRVSYPIHHIENIVKPVSKAGHASKIIFLTADAFGVLPPVSKLNLEQTQYHFLSGYTSKLAGTEMGVNNPESTFSACFGAAFLSLHPTKYGEVLVKKMLEHNASAYLVNTGWNGTGNRISIHDTRAIIDAILDGSIEKAETKIIPIFDLEVPLALHDVDSGILDPRDTYTNHSVWNVKARDLAVRFIQNFKQYTNTHLGKDLVKAGPQI